MAAPEQLSEQHQLEELMNNPEWLRQQQELYEELQQRKQLEALMNNPEQLEHLFEEQQLSSQLIDQMSKQEWLRQQQELYKELRRPRQIEDLMNNTEQLKQQQERQDKYVEEARTKNQKNKTGQLLGINLSRVSVKDWSSFSAKLLSKHEEDREEGKSSYRMLGDILQGGDTNHVSDDERKGKEYEDMKKLVIKECKKRLRRYI
jgi:predicted RNase H-like nuclease (RuvC/YqgF family)